MKTFFVVLLSAVFFIEVCTSATVEEAENKLKELRYETKRKVDAASLEHSKMSNEVDEVADKTKARGLEEIQKKYEKFQAKLKADQALVYRCRGSRDNIFGHLRQVFSDELIKCVDEEGGTSVRVLFDQRMGTIEYVWNAIYAAEKEIIVCGKDRQCLDAAVADVQDKFDEVDNVVKAELDISKHNTEVQIQSIKGCASRIIANAEQAFAKVHTCTYV